MFSYILKWKRFFKWSYVPFPLVLSSLLIGGWKGWNFISHMPYRNKIYRHMLPVHAYFFSFLAILDITCNISELLHQAVLPFANRSLFSLCSYVTTLSSSLFPLHGRCSVKPAVHNKMLLPLGHEKEQIYVQEVFPCFGRRQPESTIITK